MFVAVDQFGVKVNPIDTEDEELRLLSKSKMLFCPECNTLVRFASGEHVTAHFKHVHSPDCTYDSEPETEEHLKGKMLIRNWLVSRYSDVQVEFEYKIQETNQRADVFAIFPDGKKVAFEMQCSKIQGSVWKERHALYQKAGIKDFWILGQSVHKYGKTDGEIDIEKHQLVSLASTIYKKVGAVLFLDVTNATIRGLYKHKHTGWHSDTILLFNEEIYPIKEAKLFKNYIGTDLIRDDFKIWYLKRLKEEQLAKEREEADRLERERKVKKNEQFLMIKEIGKKQYLTELNSTTLDQVKNRMTQKERGLFENLLKKHGYSEEDFPGIFKVFTPCNYMIQTPYPLWQLWIYDRYIFGKKIPYSKVWIPKIKDQFYELRKKGIFRFKINDVDNHYSFAIYNYFEKLNLLNIVEQLGYQTTKYQQIKANGLPPYSGKELHNSVAYYLSFSEELENDGSEKMDDVRDLFTLYKDMIRQYQDYEVQPSINEDLLTILDFTNNLIGEKPDLGNEWEREFISKTYNLIKNGYTLSSKQKIKVKSIVNRIEKELDISLTILNN